MEVAHPHSGSSIPGRIGNWKCWFLRRGENRSTQRKTSWIKGENQQQIKLNPCMASTLGTGPGPHWWEGIALITTPPLLPSHIIIQLLKCKIPERVLLTKAICKKFSKVCGLSPLAVFTYFTNNFLPW